VILDQSLGHANAKENVSSSILSFSPLSSQMLCHYVNLTPNLLFFASFFFLLKKEYE